MKKHFGKSLGVLLVLLTLWGCKEEITHPIPDADQLIAGRLDGTWANPHNMVTPEGVPLEIFGAMRLVITTNESGLPDKFLALECPIIFSGGASDWQVSGDENDATIRLTEVGPVDEFKAKVSSKTMIVSFHMGWENTETGETGRGDFQVSLNRQ